MKKKIFILGSVAILAVIGGWAVLHFYTTSGTQERKILYWRDPMIPGDRSDHPGISPMGMQRVPVYDSTSAESAAASSESFYYTCPMHPTVHKDTPGSCPICGMTLVKKSIQNVNQNEQVPAVSQVSLSSSKQILANVSTTHAVRRSFIRTIHAAGIVNYAEPNLRHLSARFPGRVEKLYVSFTGENVHTGDPVLEVYSPEATSAEREYILARNAYREASSDSESSSADAQALLDQSKSKLLRWGFTENQIAQLDTVTKIPNLVTIYSPIDGTVIRKYVELQSYASAGDNLFDVADLSTVWVEADVYESDLPFVRVGEPITAVVDGLPGSRLSGKVTFINPTIDQYTRTIRVRAACSGAAGRLAVGMYVEVSLESENPPSIVVPASAVLSTGERQIVWVKTAPETFEGHLVTTGARSDELVQILDGIREGDEVVISGGYLIDSESQLRTDNQVSPTSQH